MEQGLGGGGGELDVIRRTGRQHCQAQEVGVDERPPAQAFWPPSLRAELVCCPVRLERHRGRLSAVIIGSRSSSSLDSGNSSGSRIGAGQRDTVAADFQRFAQVVFGGCGWDAPDP